MYQQVKPEEHSLELAQPWSQLLLPLVVVVVLLVLQLVLPTFDAYLQRFSPFES